MPEKMCGGHALASRREQLARGVPRRGGYPRSHGYPKCFPCFVTLCLPIPRASGARVQHDCLERCQSSARRAKLETAARHMVVQLPGPGGSSNGRPLGKDLPQVMCGSQFHALHNGDAVKGIRGDPNQAPPHRGSLGYSLCEQSFSHAQHSQPRARVPMPERAAQLGDTVLSLAAPRAFHGRHELSPMQDRGLEAPRVPSCIGTGNPKPLLLED